MKQIMETLKAIYKAIVGLFSKKKATPVIKFGAMAKIGDPRTIQFTSLLNTENLPPLPDKYMVDAIASKRVPTPMFQNDVHNCCVIAARGHVTYVFEDYEQGITISIQEYEVMNEYYKQSGGADNGLYMLNSIKLWQSQGWIAGGKNYNIYAFAQVNHTDHAQVCHAIIMLKGLYVAMNLSTSCPAQWQYGNPWTYAPRDSIIANHCVYIIGFDSVGPICVTWGKIQHMTWEFWDNMCTECYAIIDNKDNWIDPATNPLNVEECQRQLDAIKAIPPNTLTSVKVNVVDKYMMPIENCMVGVLIGDAPQTFAYTIQRSPNATAFFTPEYGFALFNGLKLGQVYRFFAEFQTSDRKATLPITITKVLSATDASTTKFTIQIPINYTASIEAGTIIE